MPESKVHDKYRKRNMCGKHVITPEVQEIGMALGRCPVCYLEDKLGGILRPIYDAWPEGLEHNKPASFEQYVRNRARRELFVLMKGYAPSKELR